MKNIYIKNEEIYDKKSHLIIKNFDKKHNLNFVSEMDDSIDNFLSKVAYEIRKKGLYYFHSMNKGRVGVFPNGIMSKCIGEVYKTWEEVPNSLKVSTYEFWIEEFKILIKESDDELEIAHYDEMIDLYGLIKDELCQE